MRIKMKGRSLKPEDISFDVTCPVGDCGREYSVSVRRPQFAHQAARCGHGQFFVIVTAMTEEIDLQVVFEHGKELWTKSVQPANVTVKGDKP